MSQGPNQDVSTFFFYFFLPKATFLKTLSGKFNYYHYAKQNIHPNIWYFFDTFTAMNDKKRRIARMLILEQQISNKINLFISKKQISVVLTFALISESETPEFSIRAFAIFFLKLIEIPETLNQ
jgi:hypothetical protein